jgi:hypothetical protein
MYKAYLTQSLEYLLNEVYIGEFDSHDEAFKAAYQEHVARGYHTERYSRGLIHVDGNYFDVGSYTHFIAILHS